MLATATCGWLMAVEQQGARAALDAVIAGLMQAPGWPAR
jgi:hypothetical protein